MTTRNRPRTPASAAETDALGAWRQALPATAMTVLADAGYNQAAREEFLRNVTRTSPGTARNYSQDRWVTAPAGTYEAGVRDGAAAGARARRDEHTGGIHAPDRAEYKDGHADGYIAGYHCQARREEAGAETGCYGCPCCGDIIYAGPDGRIATCDDCYAAGCEPNRAGAYDDCRRPCPDCGDPLPGEWHLLVTWRRPGGAATWTEGYLCGEHLPAEADVPGAFIPGDGQVTAYHATRLPR